jgi:hypothetical protein
VILERLDVEVGDLAAGTGWDVKPQGACKEDRCVPLPPDARVGERIAAPAFAQRLGMALVADDEHGLWALGPESGGRALTSARMPDLELPDRHGRPFALRSLRGTRFVMVAWASW